MELKTCFVGLTVVIVAMGVFAPRFAPRAFEWMFTNFIATEVALDFDENAQQLLTLAELRGEDAFEEQRYLIVGG